MKKYLSLLLAICFMTMASPSHAQALEDGEAFYIYRNDGDFNGFFFDEVLEMRYSTYDLDMVEFDDYVVQEIVTADSVYRIPLCAIDSVSFVQPPIEFNPRLRYISKEVYGDYYATYDHLRNILDLHQSIPDDLLPDIGDVLIGFCSELAPGLSYYDSFGIKVESRTFDSRTKRWKLAGGKIDKLSDVFTKFVSTERLTYTPDGKSVRRMAGLKTLATRSDASGSLNLIDLQGSLTREFEEGKTGTLAITLDYGIKAGISVTYDIDMDHIFVRMATDQELSAQAGVSGSLSASWEPPIDIVPSWLTAIRFPACLPIFETQPVPSLFFKAEGKVTLKSTLPKVSFKSKQLVIISDRTGNWLNCKCSSNLTSGYGEGDENLIQPGDSRLTFEGYIHSGVKYEAKIKTNSWAEKLFQSSIGLDVCIGPKLSAHVDVSLPELAKGNVDYYTLKNAYVDFTKCSLDLEAKANVKLYGYPDQEAKFGDMSTGWGSTKLYAVADVKYASAPVVDYQNNTITANLQWKNDVLFGHQVGFAVFKKHNLEVGRHDDDECVYDDSWHHFRNENEKEFVTSQLDAGTYWFSPYVTFLGEKVFVGYEERDFGPIVDLKVDTIRFAGLGENGFVTAVIPFTCNDDIKVSVMKNGGGIETFEVDNKAKTITVTIPDNTMFYPRTGDITITCVDTSSPIYSNNGRIFVVPYVQERGEAMKSIHLLQGQGYLGWWKSSVTETETWTRDDNEEVKQREYAQDIQLMPFRDNIPCTTTYSNGKLTISAVLEEENKSVNLDIVLRLLYDGVALESLEGTCIRIEEYGNSKTTTTEEISMRNKETHKSGGSENGYDKGQGYSSYFKIYAEEANCHFRVQTVKEDTYQDYNTGKPYYLRSVKDAEEDPAVYGSSKALKDMTIFFDR